jgi:hypothetical protein
MRPLIAFVWFVRDHGSSIVLADPSLAAAFMQGLTVGAAVYRLFRGKVADMQHY